MKKLKIGFLGGGNMAEAIIAGLLRAGHGRADLYVTDISAQRRKALEESYGIRTMEDNCQLAAQVDVLLLAVKPQQMTRALKGE